MDAGLFNTLLKKLHSADVGAIRHLSTYAIDPLYPTIYLLTLKKIKRLAGVIAVRGIHYIVEPLFARYKINIDFSVRGFYVQGKLTNKRGSLFVASC
jgi:hypothetical protein